MLLQRRLAAIRWFGMAGVAALTEREAAYAEHVRRAKLQGISLLEYCRQNELRVGEWYQVRRELVRKGLMSRLRYEGRRTAARLPALAFAAVRVTATPVAMAGMGCRMRHPSGWTIECASLPPASWLSAVVAGERC